MQCYPHLALTPSQHGVFDRASIRELASALSQARCIKPQCRVNTPSVESLYLSVSMTWILFETKIVNAPSNAFRSSLAQEHDNFNTKCMQYASYLRKLMSHQTHHAFTGGHRSDPCWNNRMTVTTKLPKPDTAMLSLCICCRLVLSSQARWHYSGLLRWLSDIIRSDESSLQFSQDTANLSNPMQNLPFYPSLSGCQRLTSTKLWIYDSCPEPQKMGYKIDTGLKPCLHILCLSDVNTMMYLTVVMNH